MDSKDSKRTETKQVMCRLTDEEQRLAGVDLSETQLRQPDLPGIDGEQTETPAPAASPAWLVPAMELAKESPLIMRAISATEFASNLDKLLSTGVNEVFVRDIEGMKILVFSRNCCDDANEVELRTFETKAETKKAFRDGLDYIKIVKLAADYNFSLIRERESGVFWIRNPKARGWEKHIDCNEEKRDRNEVFANLLADDGILIETEL